MVPPFSFQQIWEGKMGNETLIPLDEFIKAERSLKQILKPNPLEKNDVLSENFDCNVYLKREDLQVVRSFKIRGAYNKMSRLTPEEREIGVVCASAGNHAQGVAYSCNAMHCKGTIFMPVTTPKQKVAQVSRFGCGQIEIVLQGDTYDDSCCAAQAYANENEMIFIHPFDDPLVIAGQGTIGLEIMNDKIGKIDYIFVPIGGGGLAAGIGAYSKQISPETKIIGVEPSGAASMKLSLNKGVNTPLNTVDKFVDGAAVKHVGDLTFDICRDVLDDIITVPEGKVCSCILALYNHSAIVLEPAGALSLAALDFYKDKIKGKNVVAVVSGGNNDIARMQEIKERSLLYENLQHYFIIDFPQRPGALKEFVVEVLGPNDDITRFEYTKSNNKEQGPTLVGVELHSPDDYQPLLDRLNAKGFHYTIINQSQQLFNLFVL